MAQPNDLKNLQAHLRGIANQVFDNAGDPRPQLPPRAADFFRGLGAPVDPNEIPESPRVLLMLVLSLIQQRNDAAGRVTQLEAQLNALDRRVQALERRGP
jgi:hypothetical protein